LGDERRGRIWRERGEVGKKLYKAVHMEKKERGGWEAVSITSQCNSTNDMLLFIRRTRVTKEISVWGKQTEDSTRQTRRIIGVEILKCEQGKQRRKWNPF